MNFPLKQQALLPNALNKTADFIRANQKYDGAIPWQAHDKLDPWDHCEAAMALSVAGYWQEAELAYDWLAQHQSHEGFWHAAYFFEETSKEKKASAASARELCETNFIAYIATGVWQHYLITGNIDFLSRLFPVIERAINCVLRFQHCEGDIAWAFNLRGQAESDSLFTAYCSILRSLEHAILSAQKLGKETEKWRSAWYKLHRCILTKPSRFDRTWESKARFAMDWYYPILGGAYSAREAKSRIESRWQEFVVDKLGCRCVNDEPWITVAETCELIIALVAANDRAKAQKMFELVHQWQDKDGGYWTGYVFRDRVIWPEEKTSWTAAAVILAADALGNISPAARIFTTPSVLLETL